MPATNPTHIPALEIHDLLYRWPGSDSPALYIPQLTMGPGERVFLLGTSGSGKSTLLNLVAGIITPQRGSIRLFGQELTALGERARDRFRARNIGLVFQQFNLLPWLDVATNIRLACSFGGNTADGSHARMLALLESLQLDADLLTRRADRLSVGQQQRVAIARALINDPQLLIADEPTSALDSAARDGFIELLLQVQHARGITVLFVSHDAALAGYFSRVLDMQVLNQVAQCGRTDAAA